MADQDFQALADQIRADRQSAPAQAIANLDSNPDDAARSIQLERSTGMPAAVIFPDLPNFERTAKANATSNLLALNPHLSAFINADPINAAVSNGDLHNLDAISEKLSALPFNDRGSILDAAHRAFGDIPGMPTDHYGDAVADALKTPLYGLFDQAAEPPKPKPLTTSDLIFNPEARRRFIAAIPRELENILEGLATLPKEAIESSAQDVQHLGEQDYIARSIGPAFNTALLTMGSAAKFGRIRPPRTFAEDLATQAQHDPVPDATPHPQAEALKQAGEAARPYLNKGVEPPTGLNPVLDRVKAETNATDLEALHEIEGMASELKERSPTKFAQFIDQHTNASIGIPARTALSLPEGSFSWVPGIDAELAAARTVGTDVRIPLSDWLTNSTPELRSAVGNEIRTRPGGTTPSEAVSLEAGSEKSPSGSQPPVFTDAEQSRLNQIAAERRFRRSPSMYAAEEASIRDAATQRTATPPLTPGLQAAFDARTVRNHLADPSPNPSWAAAVEDLRARTQAFPDSAKPYANGAIPEGIPPTWANQIRTLLSRAGQALGPLRDTPASFADFIARQRDAYSAVHIPDFLLNPNWSRTVPNMTAGEFSAVESALRSLEASGRADLSLGSGSTTVPFAEAKPQLIDRMSTFPAVDGPKWKVTTALKAFGARLLKLEYIFRRWDGGDPNGPWTRLVLQPLVAAENNLTAVVKSFANRLPDAPRGRVENTLFRSPVGSRGLLDMDRSNLHAVMLNAENPIRLARMAADYSLNPADITAWINRVAKPADISYVKTVSDLFKEAGQAHMDSTGLSKYLGAPLDGWYPLIEHPTATTPTVWLDSTLMPIRLRQILASTHLRPALADAAKVFKDPDIRAAIRDRYGQEYTNLLDPYLKNVAGNHYVDTASLGADVSLANALRRNLTWAEIAFNLSTVAKHGLSAAVNSMTEVGWVNFWREFAALATDSPIPGESNWAFAMRMSQELQRRHANFSDQLSGGPQGLRSTFGDTVRHWGTAPVAVADKLSAVPTWLAAYKTAIGKGFSETSAVRMADTSVRNAHGSMSPTAQAQIMSASSPLGRWMTSLYGFFSHMMNNIWEAGWRTKDAAGQVRSGDYASAKANATKAAGLAFSSWFMPGLIHEFISGGLTDPTKTVGDKAKDTLLSSTLGPIPVARDLIYALQTGHDPSGGQIASAGKAAIGFPHELLAGKPDAAHNARLVRKLGDFMGLFAPVPQVAGKAAQFTLNTQRSLEHPGGLWDWTKGVTFGTLKHHQ